MKPLLHKTHVIGRIHRWFWDWREVSRTLTPQERRADDHEQQIREYVESGPLLHWVHRCGGEGVCDRCLGIERDDAVPHGYEHEDVASAPLTYKLSEVV